MTGILENNTATQSEINGTFVPHDIDSFNGLCLREKKWKIAEESFRKALQIFIDNMDRPSQAATLNQLGRAAHEQGCLDEAEQFFNESLEIKREVGSPLDEASAYHNLGMVAQDHREWKLAKRHYNQALQLKIEHSDRKDQASTLHQMGLLYHLQKRWDEAKDYYGDALKTKDECRCFYESAATLHQLGRLAEDQGAYEAAVDYALRAIAIYDGHNDPKLLISIKMLARILNENPEFQIPQRLSEILDVEAEGVEAFLFMINSVEETRMN